MCRKALYARLGSSYMHPWQRVLSLSCHITISPMTTASPEKLLYPSSQLLATLDWLRALVTWAIYVSVSEIGESAVAHESIMYKLTSKTSR